MSCKSSIKLNYVLWRFSIFSAFQIHSFFHRKISSKSDAWNMKWIFIFYVKFDDGEYLMDSMLWIKFQFQIFTKSHSTLLWSVFSHVNECQTRHIQKCRQTHSQSRNLNISKAVILVCRCQLASHAFIPTTITVLVLAVAVENANMAK